MVAVDDWNFVDGRYCNFCGEEEAKAPNPLLACSCFFFVVLDGEKSAKELGENNGLNRGQLEKIFEVWVALAI